MSSPWKRTEKELKQMKFETKLNKILALENDKIKLYKLYSLAFSVVSSSPAQKIVLQEIDKLISKGITL